MTKIEKIVREFSDLFEFYSRIQKLKKVNKKEGPNEGIEDLTTKPDLN